VVGVVVGTSLIALCAVSFVAARRRALYCRRLHGHDSIGSHPSHHPLDPLTEVGHLFEILLRNFKMNNTLVDACVVSNLWRGK
jgi:hypothetical protein